MTKAEIHKSFSEDQLLEVDKQIKKLSKKKKVDEPFDKKAVLAKLAKAGIHGEVAERLISRALPNVSSRPEVNELYNEAIRMLGPRELMVTETEGGNKGVAVMTSAASAKGEKLVGKKRQETYVFNPNPRESD
ncbi:MAG: hypothetical protein KBD25_03860 [Rickettsiaceae bacterium]|nr:hypothetical protein [Rickettsiaceae bacterium]